VDKRRGKTFAALTDTTPTTETGIDAGDPLPLAVRQSPLWRWATPALSVAMLAVIAWQLFGERKLDLVSAIPAKPLFWIVLLSYWAAPIVSDFIIYRRLWNIPYEGLIALARKQVGNALLFDLLGEAYFYGWARRKVKMATSPFGAVKDVTILSALVGNAVTLLLIAVALPYFDMQLPSAGPVTAQRVALAIGAVMLVSVLIIIFGKRLFSLAKADLWSISLVHLLRVLATTGLIALAWSLYDPAVNFQAWALLAVAKLMLSRLPLFLNAEVIFAFIVISIPGTSNSVVQVVGVVTILTLLIHFAVGAVLAIGDLIPARRTAKENVH
jgi:hypothetical protein